MFEITKFECAYTWKKNRFLNKDCAVINEVTVCLKSLAWSCA